MFEKFRAHRAKKEEVQRIATGIPLGVHVPKDAIYIPTPEWINPYIGLSDEQKAKMVEQFEEVPLPPGAEAPETVQGNSDNIPK